MGGVCMCAKGYFPSLTLNTALTPWRTLTPSIFTHCPSVLFHFWPPMEVILSVCHMFTWSLSACPSVRAGTFSQSLLSFSKPPIAPGPWQALRATYEREGGRKEHRTEMFSGHLLYVPSIWFHSTCLVAGTWSVLQTYTGPSLRMFSELGQDHLAQIPTPLPTWGWTFTSLESHMFLTWSP